MAKKICTFLVFFLGGLLLVLRMTNGKMVYAGQKQERSTHKANLQLTAKQSNGNVMLSRKQFKAPRGHKWLYRKVVRSSTNPNPVYPEDGYIKYEGNIKFTSYTDQNPGAGKRYYRVCAITTTTTKKHRYCSNVVRVVIGENKETNPYNLSQKTISELNKRVENYIAKLNNQYGTNREKKIASLKKAIANHEAKAKHKKYKQTSLYLADRLREYLRKREQELQKEQNNQGSQTNTSTSTGGETSQTNTTTGNTSSSSSNSSTENTQNPTSNQNSSSESQPSTTGANQNTGTNVQNTNQNTGTNTQNTGTQATNTTSTQADVTVTVNATKTFPISPYIYGVNYFGKDYWKNLGFKPTIGRLGGNRWTAYNRENNASNAGSDWYFQNDSYLGGGDVPAGAVIEPIQDMQTYNAASLITVPILGYVAADKRGDGNVTQTPNYLQTRFHRLEARKQGPLSLVPSTGDNVVYTDEFVNAVMRHQNNSQIFFCLDNEPDLRSHTHQVIHPQPATYQEVIEKGIAHAKAIKSVAPNALVFGPVSYGRYGFTHLQGASDRNGRDFLDAYLAAMRQASESEGKRLLDVLDVHRYPEAQGGGVRIIENVNNEAIAQARIQAPRSLRDPTYVEDSWITRHVLGNKAIALIPRLKEKIERNYPGTKIAITEYYYGGGDSIDGAIAQADVLGIFGREGVFQATLRDLYPQKNAFIKAAFHMYRNYDGQGSSIGDIGLEVTNPKPEDLSVYATKDSNNKVFLVIINKKNQQLSLNVGVQGITIGTIATVYQLTKNEPRPVAKGTLQTQNNSLGIVVPAMSVTTVVIQ